MNDIVERLRAAYRSYQYNIPLFEEAAKEIEQLRNDLQEMTCGDIRYTQLAQENKRLQNSINNCSTEEGLCYANELDRKDKEIERLQRYEDYVLEKSKDNTNKLLEKMALPSLCWHCSNEEGFYESPCKYCSAINPNVDLEGALAQQKVWNAC